MNKYIKEMNEYIKDPSSLVKQLFTTCADVFDSYKHQNFDYEFVGKLLELETLLGETKALLRFQSNLPDIHGIDFKLLHEKQVSRLYDLASNIKTITECYSVKNHEAIAESILNVLVDMASELSEIGIDVFDFRWTK